MRRALPGFLPSLVCATEKQAKERLYVSAKVSARAVSFLSIGGRRTDSEIVVFHCIARVRGRSPAQFRLAKLKSSREKPGPVGCRSQCFSQPSTILDGRSARARSYSEPQRSLSFASYTWVLYLGFLVSVLAYYIWVSYLTLSWPLHWVLIKLQAVRSTSRSISSDEAAVQLYVYDLSNGLAQQLSPVLLNKQIDGIWHTAIVVGGLEYYYGAGISQSGPGLTPFGKPLRIIELGCTCIPRGQQETYLRDLQLVYTAQAYSLFHHNCNHFTNDFATFLTGAGIPGHILTLPEDLLATPFGQMLAPMLSPLEKRLGTIRQQPAGRQTAVPFKGQQLAAALTPDHAQVLALATADAVPPGSASQAMSAVRPCGPASAVKVPAALSVPAFVKDATVDEATMSSSTVNNGPVVKLAAKDIVKATGLAAWLRLYAARRLLRRKRRERRYRQSCQQVK